MMDADNAYDRLDLLEPQVVRRLHWKNYALKIRQKISSGFLSDWYKLLRTLIFRLISTH